jgi:hypothetical protein
MESGIKDSDISYCFNIICCENIYFEFVTFTTAGACGSELVEALCYKPEGRGFVSR